MRGRNDNYGSTNYIERTNFCLNIHIENFLSLGLKPEEVEIVFVDWGSDKPIISLIDCEKEKFIKYIIVPKNITEISDPPETGFDFVKSVNVGIYRANGKFIMHIDPDVFIDTKSFQKLWKYINNSDAINYQHYFTKFILIYENCNRLMSNVDFSKKDYNEKIESINSTVLIKPAIESSEVFNGGSNAVMCSKDAWFKVGGYDERFVYWGAQDVDLFTRLSNAGYSGKDLYQSNGIKLVHMEHTHKLCDKTNNPELSHRKALNGISPNGKNWGISNLKFQEVIV